MEVRIAIYNSSGSGGVYFENNYDVFTFEEFKNKIIQTYQNAKNESVIRLKDEIVEGYREWILLSNPKICLETSLSAIIKSDAFSLKTCFVYNKDISFPHSGGDFDYEWSGFENVIEKLGKLNFDPNLYEEEEYIKELFNFYLSKS
jgi:hypothetical protein